MGVWERAMEIPEEDPRHGRRGPLWLHPDDDLAPNRPGETLLGELAARPAGRLRRLGDRLLLRAAETDALRSAVAAEQTAGTLLDRLSGFGWRVLHSLPLPGGTGLPHLAIGPGGVLAVRSCRHRGARLRAGFDGADLVSVNGRRTEPHLRRCRRDAQVAAHALGRACGSPVAVTPLLVFVEAADVAVAPTLRDVEVLPERALPALAERGGVLKPQEIDLLYGLARDRRTWRGL
ncbi:nuclease-related domain-containing protein [Streptomyces hoynatensis]|uniref:NERD domain-containing protein n=1 Tax=Streptomyces hoynatensis TaxID=1141874 RepID=A0A3A9YRG4_9ACTN|nr:nuclease-related domain-containing protein [Streptomyces hoynatensis]RKN38593.1 NERD domain-containing protein [Streptomyces hoynatensis]